MASWDNREVTNRHLLPYVDAESAPPEVAAALNTLPFQRNIFKLLANAQVNFPPFMKLLATCWNPDLSLRSSEYQVTVLRTASLLDAPYEWDVNEPVARVLGFDTDEKLHLIRIGDLSNTQFFTPRHRLISQMVFQLVHDNVVSEATMRQAIELLGNAATMEVMMIHGVYSMLARIMNSARIDFDPPIPGLEDKLRKYNAVAIQKEKEAAAQD
jgi:hypothetical protein